MFDTGPARDLGKIRRAVRQNVIEAYPRCNFAATGDPGAGDDEDDGYSVGSIWINTGDGSVFICTDPTGSSAVWAELYNGATPV